MTQQQGKLAGRRVLITAAGSGIGRATARLFVVEGAAAGLLDRDAVALAQSVDELGAAASGQVADVANDAHVAVAVAALAGALGGLDMGRPRRG